MRIAIWRAPLRKLLVLPQTCFSDVQFKSFWSGRRFSQSNHDDASLPVVCEIGGAVYSKSPAEMSPCCLLDLVALFRFRMTTRQKLLRLTIRPSTYSLEISSASLRLRGSYVAPRLRLNALLARAVSPNMEARLGGFHFLRTRARAENATDSRSHRSSQRLNSLDREASLLCNRSRSVPVDAYPSPSESMCPTMLATTLHVATSRSHLLFCQVIYAPPR